MLTIREQIVHVIDAGGIDGWVPEPGKIYAGISNEKYHDDRENPSSSGLKIIHAETLQHFFDAKPRKTKSMSLGDNFHGALETNITGGKIEDKICVIPDYKKTAIEPVVDFIVNNSPEPVDRINLKNKLPVLKEKAMEIEKQLANGRDVVSQSEFDQSQAMANALRDNPDTGKLFKMNGVSELSFYHSIPINIDGKIVWITVRVRPDLLIESASEVWIIDWKSIGKAATVKNIRRQMWDYRYDMSGGLYRDAVANFTDKPVRFFLVFAESADPKKEKVQMMEMQDIDLAAGFDDCFSALTKLARWRVDHGWAGYDRYPLGYRTDITMRNAA